MDPILPSEIPQSAMRNPQSSRETDRLGETAREFEGVFLGLLLKAMRGTVDSGGLFKEGTDSQIYRDMFDQEIGQGLARAGGIGLAQMILRDQALRQATRAAAGNPATGKSAEALENRGVSRPEGSPADAAIPGPRLGEETSQVPSPTDRYPD